MMAFSKRIVSPTKIINSFKRENIQIQFVLGYRIDLYFHDFKLTMEIDENRLSDRNVDYEIKRKMAIE